MHVYAVCVFVQCIYTYTHYKYIAIVIPAIELSSARMDTYDWGISEDEQGTSLSSDSVELSTDEDFYVPQNNHRKKKPDKPHGGPSSSTRCLTSLSRRYKTVCVTTSGALVVLVWSALLQTTGMLYYTYSPLQLMGKQSFLLPLRLFYAIGLLFYPLAGFIGEVKWTKAKMMVLGSLVMLAGQILLAVSVALTVAFKLALTNWVFIAFLPLVLVILGKGAFEANVIQYGRDQLDFASSEVLSSFVYWCYWTQYLPTLLLILVSQLASLMPMSSIVLSVGSFLPPLIAVAVLLCLYSSCRKNMLAELGKHVSPMKLIWRVMKFAWQHKHPLRRSAFTYSELPSRLDLAKKRYGGPFRTEEVEEVKSFWSILFLLASLFGYLFWDDIASTAAKYAQLYACSDVQQTAGSIFCLHSNDNRTEPTTIFMEAFSVYYITTLTIVLTIPLYQLVLRPWCGRFIPSMVVRMGMGLLLELFSLLILTALNFNMESDSSHLNVSCGSLATTGQTANVSTLAPFSIYLFVIPQFLNGLSQVLVSVTTLEFILAQAPVGMQGFLIGLWYSMQSVHVFVSILEENVCAFSLHWMYFTAKSIVVVVAIAVFGVATSLYKYRRMDEDIDINVYTNIEQHFWRNLKKSHQQSHKRRDPAMQPVHDLQFDAHA